MANTQNFVFTNTLFASEKAMVVSLSSLMNDSVPDKVVVRKYNLPIDTLLLLDLAHGPESDVVKIMWNRLQNHARQRGKIDCAVCVPTGSFGLHKSFVLTGLDS